MTTIYRDREILVARARGHREADELRQGYWYWRRGKGCAIGCLAHDDARPHQILEEKYGLPARLSFAADAIFEGLSPDESRDWPERYASAAKEGADLSNVWNLFALWLLAESGLLPQTRRSREAIETIAQLYRRASVGEVMTCEAWTSETGAWVAKLAASTPSAAEAAEEAGEAAAASVAARAAAWAADAATSPAAAAVAMRAAAGSSESYEKMAAKLVELMGRAQPKKKRSARRGNSGDQ